MTWSSSSPKVAPIAWRASRARVKTSIPNVKEKNNTFPGIRPLARIRPGNPANQQRDTCNWNQRQQRIKGVERAGEEFPRTTS